MLTNHIKKAHAISKTTTTKEFMEIFTNDESDNNDKKNIEIDKLEVEHTKK